MKSGLSKTEKRQYNLKISIVNIQNLYNLLIDSDNSYST